MLKVLLTSAVFAVGMTSVVDAQTVVTHRHHRTVAANGRCGGVSYGTGARRCGSLSGGPAGGNSSRN